MGLLAAKTPKHRLVIEICSSSKRSGNVCAHRASCRSESRFVDWYSLLGVEENANGDVIRRRYRKLALQVHPDKNDHPDAGIAFKLVAEAYNCLSDAAKRKAFDKAKWKNACPQCRNLQLCRNRETDKSPEVDPLKSIRDRFREELRVIRYCMRAHMDNPTTKGYHWRNWSETFANISLEGKGTPVFDPSRYEFSGYPHVRSRVVVDKGIESDGSAGRPRKDHEFLGVARARKLDLF